MSVYGQDYSEKKNLLNTLESAYNYKEHKIKELIEKHSVE